MTTVNLKDSPLIKIIFAKRYDKKEDFLPLINSLEKSYQLAQDKNSQFCLLLDTSNVEYANPILAMELVKWLADKKSLSKKYLICTCVLIKNNLIQNFLNIILKFFVPTNPYFVVKNSAEMYVYSMLMTVYSKYT